MKLISFTVPCYNSADYMHICIDSLLTGGDRVEIIIIDDGSSDQTGAIADAYAAKYPDTIKVVHQENGGHGEGINQGLKHATCPYFKVVGQRRLGQCRCAAACAQPPGRAGKRRRRGSDGVQLCV